MFYINTNTQEIRELDPNMVQMWKDTNNPKLSLWNQLPPKPSNDAVWVDNNWVISQAQIPENISARQIRLWLIQNGISLQSVTNAINAIEDQILRDSITIEWEYAPYIERSHPMLVPLAQNLGLTENQIDQAFIEAQYI